MSRWIWLSVAGLLAACDAPQAPVTTGADGQQAIGINTGGLTCYDSLCLDISIPARSVRAIGYRTIGIPGDINVGNGTVTPAEFKRLGVAALSAGGVGSDGDR